MRALGTLVTVMVAGVALAASPVPRPAKSLTVTTQEGRTISLQQLRGKVVVVMFFSTDCPHCQTATQAIAPIYADWRSRGLEILGLAVNPSAKDNLGDFARRYHASFPLALGTRSDWAGFGEFSVMKRPPYVPHMLFVDRQGVIREERNGGDRSFHSNLQSNFAALVDRLLNEPAGG